MAADPQAVLNGPASTPFSHIDGLIYLTRVPYLAPPTCATEEGTNVLWTMAVGLAKPSPFPLYRTAMGLGGSLNWYHHRRRVSFSKAEARVVIIPRVTSAPYTFLSRPARRTVQRAGLYVPLIPIEQSNLHKLYTNRIKILIMASDTRERHASGEPHPPVSRSPCTYRVSTSGCVRYHEH